MNQNYQERLVYITGCLKIIKKHLIFVKSLYLTVQLCKNSAHAQNKAKIENPSRV